MWSYVVEETVEAGENHGPLTGDHCPATCLYSGSNLSKRVFYHRAIQALMMGMSVINPCPLIYMIKVAICIYKQNFDISEVVYCFTG